MRALVLLDAVLDGVAWDADSERGMRAIGEGWTSPDPHTPHPTSIDLLAAIAAPTTVVTGELDVPCFHEMSEVLADRIPGARKLTVPAVGHMVNMEAPEAVNALLRELVLDRSLA